MRKMFRYSFFACAFIILLAGSAAATEPAVSQINAKAGTTIGSVDGDSVYIVDGSATIPLAGPAGIQIDAGFGTWDADQPIGETDITRFGLHLFTRNPELGLAGIYASRNELDSGGTDRDINQYAVEAEYYTRLKDAPLTIASVLGQTDPERGSNEKFGTLDIRWYPLDNFMVEIGTALVDNDVKGHLGAEYQFLQSLTSFLALSAYVDLAIGEESYDHALFGLRAYFAPPKNLPQRHRQDSLSHSTDRLNPPLFQ